MKNCCNAVYFNKLWVSECTHVQYIASKSNAEFQPFYAKEGDNTAKKEITQLYYYNLIKSITS